MFTLTGVTFSPSLLGLTLLLFLLYALARAPNAAIADRLIIIILYSAVVITHGLSSIIGAYLILLSSLAKPSDARRPDTVKLGLGMAAVTVFFSWLMHSSDFLFRLIVSAFQENVIRTRFAFSSAAYHVSLARPGREEITQLTLVFLLVLCMWIVLSIVACRLRRGLSGEVSLPLVTVAGMPLIILGTGSFTYEGLVRVYFYAVPFLAWFLGHECTSRKTSLAFLLMLLGLGFVLLYAREFEELPSATQIAGSSFIARGANPSVTILQGECIPIGAVAGIVDGFSTTCLASQSNLRRPLPDFNDFSLTVLSKPGQSVVSFLLGEERWRNLSRAVSSAGLPRLYSNGEYDVYGSR